MREVESETFEDSVLPALRREEGRAGHRPRGVDSLGAGNGVDSPREPPGGTQLARHPIFVHEARFGLPSCRM